MKYQEETIEKEDFYQMYLDDLSEISQCTAAERELLLARAVKGDGGAKKRLVEGHLKAVCNMAAEYAGGPVPAGDLLQEANMALVLAVEEYKDRDFLENLETAVKKALEEIIEDQRQALKTGEEVAARVNVLQEVSKILAKELGREATVEELAEKMKMSEEEIREIMKITLDAISAVSGELE